MVSPSRKLKYELNIDINSTPAQVGGTVFVRLECHMTDSMILQIIF